MVEITGVYEGDLRCRLTHGPSGAEIRTDAPKDNEGRGESFSPTDLTAASLGACMLTIMGIFARRHGVNLGGTAFKIVKEMAAAARRIAKLTVEIRMAPGIPKDLREPLERAGLGCPVHHSLPESVERPVRFVYPD